MGAFNIDVVIEQLREAVKPFPQAAMFALADEGFNSLFEQLISCIISIRTYDEVSLPVSRRLFSQANTASAICQLSVEEIEQLIQPSTYADRKARQIQAIGCQIVEQYNGDLPADAEVLLSFNGVGLKCAHLALGIACDLPYISVDTHVHRITNRWGYVQTKTPEKTTLALELKLPKTYWVEINRLLVPFGKHICLRTLPHCSTCPIQDMCQQINVDRHL